MISQAQPDQFVNPQRKNRATGCWTIRNSSSPGKLAEAEGGAAGALVKLLILSRRSPQ